MYSDVQGHIKSNVEVVKAANVGLKVEEQCGYMMQLHRVMAETRLGWLAICEITGTMSLTVVLA